MSDVFLFFFYPWLPTSTLVSFHSSNSRPVLCYCYTQRDTYIDTHTLIKPTGSMHLEKTDFLLAATNHQALHKGDWRLTSWAILTWVACVVTHGYGILWSKQLLRAMSGCPSTASICINVYDSAYHLRQHRYPGSGLTLEAMLVPEGYAATRVIKF